MATTSNTEITTFNEIFERNKDYISTHLQFKNHTQEQQSTCNIILELATLERVKEITHIVNRAYLKEGYIFEEFERKRTNEEEITEIVENQTKSMEGIICLIDNSSKQLMGSVFVSILMEENVKKLYFGMLAKVEGLNCKFEREGRVFTFAQMVINEIVVDLAKLLGCKYVSCKVFNCATQLINMYKTKCHLKHVGEEPFETDEVLRIPVVFLKLEKLVE
ncbi:hypothetical protein ABK040_002562 [Willaertia magna]